MKLQNLVIIFIIIIIPIVAIFTLYLNLETKTITLQTDYDAKLIEATKEAMNAFEINTTEWNNDYSSLANAKRQDLLSSINVFTNSLADKLKIGGSSKETILTYVPAIVFTMYDGYYIYAPTYVPQTVTDDKGVQLFYYKNSGSEGAKITNSATQNIGGEIVSGEPIYAGNGLTGTYDKKPISFTTDIGKAEKTYKHVLKTFVPYTTEYEDNNGHSYIINYTLDNYIRLYGEIQSKEGYVIEDFGGTNKIYIPQNSILGITFNGKEIEPEILIENIYIRDNDTEEAQIEPYPYIYNSANDKRYYDDIEKKFFMVNNNNVKVYLPDAEVGGTLAEYKKVLIRPNDTNYDYLELYQLLNESDNNWYYKNSENQYVQYDKPINGISSVHRGLDCSAINYYVETCSFNHWLKENNIEIDKILEKKTESMINNINNNLNLSISNYSANSKIDYRMPELSDSDWEQALSNISMITFFQGVKIGLKTYNNYAIVTSTENNEFVNEDSLYYLGETDSYYHRYYCEKVISNIYEAYKNTDYKVQSYKDNENVKYYFKHYNISNQQVQECFDCIVNRNNYTEIANSESRNLYNKTFYEALGRERYVQMSKINLIIKLNKTITVTSVKINQSEQWIPIESYDDKVNYTTLTAKVEAIEAADTTVTWSSSNTSVATVNSSGKVTAVGAGKATIKVELKDNPDEYDEIDVYVYNAVYNYTTARALYDGLEIKLGIQFPVGEDFLILTNTLNYEMNDEEEEYKINGASYYRIDYSKNHNEFSQKNYYFKTYLDNGSALCSHWWVEKGGHYFTKSG